MTASPYRSGARPVKARGPDTGQLPLIHGYGFETSAQNSPTVTRRATSTKTRAIVPRSFLPISTPYSSVEREILDQAVVARQLLPRERSRRPARAAVTGTSNVPPT